MYLQTFNNCIVIHVFIFGLTSEDTDSCSMSYAWKPHDIAGPHEKIAEWNA